jgi:hypothetical protein
MPGNAICEVASPDLSPPSPSCPGRLSVGGPRQPTPWEARPVPDADLLADEIVREFLAMGADLDQAADVISRTRYLGAQRPAAASRPLRKAGGVPLTHPGGTLHEHLVRVAEPPRQLGCRG